VRILDRYLLREQLLALAAGLLFFVAVYIIVDLFEKMDMYLDKHAALAVIVAFYGASIPGIVLRVLPMAMLLSCLLALGQLGRNNELTAMQTAGIGLGRIAVPLYALALLASGLVFLVNETALPGVNAQRRRILTVEIRKQEVEGPRVRSNLAYLGSDGRTFLIRSYRIDSRAMQEVVIQEIRHNTLVGRIDAQSAKWVNGRWVFYGGYTRRFEPDGEKAAQFTELTIPGLRERPEDFAEAEEDPEALSFWQLQRYIDRLRQSGSRVQRYLVELHLKIAFPLTNLIVVLIGSALSIRVKRGGLPVAFGLSVFISFLYYALIRTGQSLGHNGQLPPLLAAWAANLIFAGIGLELLRRARRGR
jgi:lipopolysaccharide export system permease protein